MPPPVRPEVPLKVTEAFWSWLLPMVVGETTAPLLKTESRALERPVMARLVVVAEVPVALVKEKVERVEEAVEMKPLLNSRVVEVAFSPVESFTNG